MGKNAVAARFADNLLCREAGNPFGGFIPVDDRPVPVYKIEPVMQACDHFFICCLINLHGVSCALRPWLCWCAVVFIRIISRADTQQYNNTLKNDKIVKEL